MNPYIIPSTLKSRVTRWIALPSLLILLPNYLAFAAITTCPAGYISDEFSSVDYSNLGSTASPPILGVNQLLNGLKGENYVIASNSLSTTGTLDSGGSNFYSPKTLAGNLQSFEFFQDFATKESTRTVSYTFTNNFSKQSQALDNVSLSIYDIDVNYVATGTGSSNLGVRYFEFSDQVTITGFTSAGAPVTPIRKYSGAGMTTTAPYRQTTTTSDVLCSTDSIDEKCKVSVAFDQPIVRVDVTYGNNPNLEYYDFNSIGNPGDQLINIVFDGYCYQPQPRLTYTKALSTSRKTNNDQFTVQIKDNADNSVVTSGITSVTTTGSNNTVTTGTGTTGTFKVNPTKTYTLTEAVSGSTNLADYTALYACRKSDGTSVSTLDPKNLKLTYGDNWTCTITNGSPNYVFSGTVFNDNGGITAADSTKQNITNTFTANSAYFNGILDSNESGIFDSALQVTLTNCNGTKVITSSANPQTVSSSGKYSFTVQPSALPTRICLVETEPTSWVYSVDTTANTREVSLNNGTYIYNNLDFGEVQANNASLVLIKSQYVHNCNINTNFNGTTGTPSQTPAFSIAEIKDIEPGKCIAYRIEAYNRGHVDLKDIQINDQLQVKSQTNLVTSVFALPVPKGDPTSLYTGTTLPTGTITSELFNLNKPTGSTPTKATLYFNTKYGTTMDTQ
ncbi:hypothetical protein [Psychrobacter sp. BI730]|uniref:hypothetical protein n=1 Tax=Psychrobacter sp. BI730 TaxID=2705463 RepID=UPI0015C7DB58|nr:hypothetical protein [Psychrobacter sp. BI730]NYR08439.1 hypothetical protein [Psychrobacter sp. BI730]